MKNSILGKNTIIATEGFRSYAYGRYLPHKQEAELRMIVVPEHKTNKGIGNRMMDEFESKALLRGAKRIILTVNYRLRSCTDRKKLRNFYTRRGYKLFDEHSNSHKAKAVKVLKNE